MRGEGFGCLMITHYQRLLNYITPDHVHVMMQGKVVKSGGSELAQRLEAEGYDWIKKELGIEDTDAVTEEAKEGGRASHDCGNKISGKRSRRTLIL